MLHTDTAIGTHHLPTISLVDLDCFPLINMVLKIVAPADFIAIDTRKCEISTYQSDRN